MIQILYLVYVLYSFSFIPANKEKFTRISVYIECLVDNQRPKVNYNMKDSTIIYSIFRPILNIFSY